MRTYDTGAIVPAPPPIEIQDEPPPAVVQAVSGTPAAPTAPSTPSAKAVRWVPDGLYDRALKSAGLLFAFLVAAALWRTDGFFTLTALSEFGIKLARIGMLQWSIPIAITGATLGLWPSRKQRSRVALAKQSWHDAVLAEKASAPKLEQTYLRYRNGLRLQIVFWLTVVAFNVATSLAGLLTWLAGRRLFNLFTMPTTGSWLLGVALVIALILAFVPEKLGRWAAIELREEWR
jgi:hypothetical protein